MTSSLPPVTVGIPMRNASATISRAIRSVLSQDYPNLLVIVSDNASTDGSAQMAQDAAAGDPRVILVEQATDIGAYANFNFVLGMADTPYFAWAAADDWSDPDYFKQCVMALESRPSAVLCHGDADESIAGHCGAFMKHVGRCGYQPGVMSRYWDVYRNFPDLHVYGVFRTDVAQSVGGMDLGPGGDITFIRKMSLRGPFCHAAGAMHHRVIAPEWKATPPSDASASNRPSTHVLLVSLGDIQEASLAAWGRVVLTGLILLEEAKRRSMVALVKACRPLKLITSSRRLATAVHMRFFSKGTYEILDEETYLRRIVRPVLGWE